MATASVCSSPSARTDGVTCLALRRINIPWGSFKRWIYAEPELREALKRGRDASDERVVDSLYRQALSGNVGAICFWLKNRRPSEWRDVQNVDAAIDHYIISDKPMSEEQWYCRARKPCQAGCFPSAYRSRRRYSQAVGLIVDFLSSTWSWLQVGSVDTPRVTARRPGGGRVPGEGGRSGSWAW
jgi:hypothetical protein